MPSRTRKVLNKSTGRYRKKSRKSPKKSRKSRKSRKSPRKSRKSRKSPRKSRKSPKKSRKIRKSPNSSATLFKLGYVQEGNDNKLWKIVKTSRGVKRWVHYK